MKTYKEFLNQQPEDVSVAWKKVEESWTDFLRVMHVHLRDNMGKYDAHSAKFGSLSGEHPDQALKAVVGQTEKCFKKMKEGLSRLGAHQMV